MPFNNGDLPLKAAHKQQETWNSKAFQGYGQRLASQTFFFFFLQTFIKLDATVLKS